MAGPITINVLINTILKINIEIKTRSIFIDLVFP